MFHKHQPAATPPALRRGHVRHSARKERGRARRGDGVLQAHARRHLQG